jgi:hypothetical protein
MLPGLWRTRVVISEHPPATLSPMPVCLPFKMRYLRNSYYAIIALESSGEKRRPALALLPWSSDFISRQNKRNDKELNIPHRKRGIKKRNYTLILKLLEKNNRNEN